MVKTLKNEYIPDSVSHPGSTLLEVIETLGMSQAELADRAGRHKKTINEIINGISAITPETSLQLERVLGIPAEFWNNREAQYREYLARKAEQERLKEDVKWIENFPIGAMAKLGWIDNPRDKLQKLRNLLTYFGVATPDSWREMWRERAVSYRKSKTWESKDGALAAWLRQGELLAQDIDCKPIDKKGFKSVLIKLRSLSSENPMEYIPKMQEICADYGIALVFVPELPGTSAWGATRWLTSEKALIQLSLRGKTDDHLWFTFFHECCHILNHGKREEFIESKDGCSEKEDEADRFSEELLIPHVIFESFATKYNFSKIAVTEFAEKFGISPGIVVGRLQNKKYISWKNLNGLKQRFKWMHE